MKIVRGTQDEVYNMGAVPLIEGKTKRQVKLTEKKEYKMAFAGEEKVKVDIKSDQNVK